MGARPLRPIVPFALVAAVLAGGCASANDRGEIPLEPVLAKLSGILGRTTPLQRVQHLAGLHDTATFRHKPDTPDTWEACRHEVAALGKSDYAEWSEAALAAWIVTRVLVDDASSLNRGDAAAALRSIGTMLADVEDPPRGKPADDAEVLAGHQRMKAIHVDGAHDPANPGAEEECTAILLRVGDYRPVGNLGDPPGSLRARYSDLRGIINLVLFAHPHDSPSKSGKDATSRALINAASQAVRTALVLALRADSAEPVRVAAADTLGQIGAVEAVPGLLRALPGETSRNARREIVQSLGTLAAANPAVRGEAVPALIEALGDEDDAVRLNARTALAGISGSDLGEVASAWTRWWSDLRRAAR